MECVFLLLTLSYVWDEYNGWMYLGTNYYCVCACNKRSQKLRNLKIIKTIKPNKSQHNQIINEKVNGRPK